VKNQVEIELKFLVPAAARAAVLAEMSRGSAPPRRVSLAAMYLDTNDRRLAKSGIAWRLRREGRRWVQTLKSGGNNSLERFEHEVERPDASYDAALHAGSATGSKLIALLREVHDQGAEVGVRFETEVRRTIRTLRTRGAVVEVAFDEGRLLSNEARQRIREVEFELVSGSATSMLALAERWRKRFGLIYDPRSKAARGDRLAEGSAYPPLRKASQPDYPDEATATQAFGIVLDECLAHITHNAIALLEGDPSLRVEHVHQLRVGVRRLRSALRSFAGWAPSPPAHLVDGLRALFVTLGQSRDRDVLDSGVAALLAEIGAPALAVPTNIAGVNPADAVRAGETQGLLLSWIAWRTALAEQPPPRLEAAPTEADTTAPQQADDNAPTFHRKAERRLRRWHRRIVADWAAFDELDDTGLHALRKRIKRQRYAVEFFAPVLRRRTIERYLKPLGTVQDRMGELNDLFVARASYQALVATDPAAWFALGWLAARIADLRLLAKRELGRLAEVDPPSC
jgi:inorganic triphosphatase YgiF